VALVDSIVPAAEVLNTDMPIRKHFISGLILQGELHVFYGDTGVGKTGVVAYEAAIISQTHDILVFVNEDTPRDFAMKFYMSGGKLEHLFVQRSKVKEMLLPRCNPELESIAASRPWGMIYFDSILDMKSTDARLDAANSARALFGPLSDLAHDYNVAVVCTAHINKANIIEGSKQIQAKARVVARVERPKMDPNADTIEYGKESQWVTHVITEKFQRGRPGSKHAFHFEETASRNPYTGKVDQELDEHGALKDVQCYFCSSHDKLALDPKDEAPVSPDLEARVTALWQQNHDISGVEVRRTIGGRSSDVYKILRKLKGKE
jgi:hypothetical protein